MVVLAADMFVDGLLAVALELGIAPFVLSVALSGFETENLATGIAANAKGLPGAARIMKKASVTTRNRVGIATSRRRPMKRNMADGPCAERPYSKAAVAKLPPAPDDVNEGSFLR